MKTSKWTFSKQGVLEDRELLSYLLGFMFADGHLAITEGSGLARKLGLYSSDKALLERITQRMGYSRDVRIHTRPRVGRWGKRVIWCQEFYAENARFFQVLGMKHGKEELSLEGVDIDIWPFLRGHVDGDGCFYLVPSGPEGKKFSSLTFLGRRKLISEIARRMEEVLGRRLCLVHYEKEGKKDLYRLIIGGRDGIYLLDKMYEGATIFLERKYQIYQAIKGLRHYNQCGEGKEGNVRIG